VAGHRFERRQVAEVEAELISAACFQSKNDDLCFTPLYCTVLVMPSPQSDQTYSEHAPRLSCQRAAFDVPDEVAYFNTASLAPQLKAVREAGEAALARQAAPWRTTSSDWFSDAEVLRGLFAQLLGVSADGVALIPATSYGMAIAAHNLPIASGERILVLGEEYPSGVYTWRALARRSGAQILTVEREQGQSWADAVLDVLDERVAIVSVPNVHWTDGSLVDLDVLGPTAKRAGAALVVDASQSLGAMELDIDRVQPDFLVTVGYKWLLGPFSIGYLYVAEQHRDGEPIEQNWILRANSEDFARLVDYRDEYQPGARRYDVGQRTNFTLTPMAIAALTQVLEWEVPRIAASLAAITGGMADEAARLGFDAPAASERGPHMLGIRLPPEVLATAPSALAAANCFVGVRGASMRLAPHLFTSGQDVERLFTTLAELLDPNRPPAHHTTTGHIA
jgi:selenocysteine lyase/cysteine desulfurase